jgi:CelD/BcsL family acetyltransferase involved in cellulose biosynthesis
MFRTQDAQAPLATVGIGSLAVPSGELRLVTVHDVAELASHVPAWDQLAWRAPQRLPTLMPGWVLAYLQHRLRPGERWFCSFAYQDGRLLGVLPAIVTPQSLLGNARPLLRTISDAQTTASGDLLLCADDPRRVLQALVGEACRQVPGHIGIEFRAVRQNSPLWSALDRTLPGYVTCKGQEISYSCVELRSDRDRYIPGHLRRNLRRFRKRLDTRGPVSIEVRPAGAGDDVLPEFLALEASGWKGRAGTAIADHPEEVAFYGELVRTFTLQQRLQWHTVRVGERLVAAGLGVRCGSALILMKIAYDESLSDCAPGALLNEAVILDASTRKGFTEINSMSKADWHRRWHMNEDRYQDLYLVRDAVLPLVWQTPLIAARRAIRNAKNHVERKLPGAVRAYRRLKRTVASRR